MTTAADSLSYVDLKTKAPQKAENPHPMRGGLLGAGHTVYLEAD